MTSTKKEKTVQDYEAELQEIKALELRTKILAFLKIAGIICLPFGLAFGFIFVFMIVLIFGFIAVSLRKIY